VLKKDARYELADPLSKHQKEEIYDEHLDALSAKKKQLYRELLEEANVALDSSWKEVRRKIKEDQRYTKFSSSDSKCEKEFHKYLKDKTSKAIGEFRELLKETKLLDYKTKSRIEESEQNMKDLVEILKNDKRYLILEPLSKDRKEILMDYIEDLAKRGPPPPPTASEPSRRSGK
jgi:transcription elongation regulator 1